MPDLSLHVLMQLHRFLQRGQPPPKVGLVRHLALVLHDLVSGFRHNVLDLSTGDLGEEKRSKNDDDSMKKGMTCRRDSETTLTRT